MKYVWWFFFFCDFWKTNARLCRPRPTLDSYRYFIARDNNWFSKSYEPKYYERILFTIYKYTCIRVIRYVGLLFFFFFFFLFKFQIRKPGNIIYKIIYIHISHYNIITFFDDSSAAMAAAGPKSKFSETCRATVTCAGITLVYQSTIII